MVPNYTAGRLGNCLGLGCWLGFSQIFVILRIFDVLFPKTATANTEHAYCDTV